VKPIVLANIAGFWNPLLELFDRMSGETFIRPGFELKMTVADRVEDILPAIESALKPYPEEIEDEAEAKIAAKF
jgi:predicted Rossmann-fold nucleotide-binding protein